jgi:tRNA(Ile)-lysidine synthase
MALLDMIWRLAPSLRLQIGVAHFDHRLRENSGEDATFVVDQAKLRGLKAFVGQGDVKLLASQEGLSIEEAGRNARYNFLKRVARKQGYTVVMTAHHADDNAETLLLNLLRGSGVTGLTGIPPVRAMGEGIILVRPLLGTERSDIERYASEAELVWREDESNASPQFKRNRVRHDLLPMLREFNPAIVETLNTTSGIMRNVEQFLTHTVELAMKKAVLTRAIDRAEISVPFLKHYLPAIQTEMVQRVISKCFSTPPVTHAAVGRVLSLVWKETGSKAEIADGISAVRDRDSICIRREIPPLPPVDRKFEPGQTVDIGRLLLKTKKIDRNSVRFTKNSNIEFVDIDRLPKQLVLRNWREGDRLHPFGMEGEKKVSDLLIDQKVPLDKKRDILVVADGDNIIWVCGIRLDDRYKVDQNSRNVLRMEISIRSSNGH